MRKINEGVYARTCEQLKRSPKTWFITGVAGFIGSSILETLLTMGQTVIGVDDLSTGTESNLEDVRRRVGDARWQLLSFHQGDVRDLELCRSLTDGTDYVLHQAGLGSVPLSLEDPISINEVNVTGFLSILRAAQKANVKRFVYASSSSVYGDCTDSAMVEDKLGNLLSPYAATKYINELYAEVFARSYGTHVIGLRYFNIFGPRQDPCGAYAAVVPKWIGELLAGEPCTIYGDGLTTRDFCYVKNVIQANILAATTGNREALGRSYNVGVGQETSLQQLYSHIHDAVCELRQDTSGISGREPIYKDFRTADIRHSVADVSLGKSLLGYSPAHGVAMGLKETVQWYLYHNRVHLN